jgi:DNA-3-methyladenine glycosylase I
LPSSIRPAWRDSNRIGRAPVAGSRHRSQRLKVASTIGNARALLAVQKEFGSFDAYVWQFVGGSPRVNRWKSHREIPSRTAESDRMSKDLAKRGFKFVGSTICYAFMQAVGMVNDHTTDCFRYRELAVTR